MDLLIIKDAFEKYQKECEARRMLIESIVANFGKDDNNYQKKYCELCEITNESLSDILTKLSFNDINNYIQQVINNPDFEELADFFMLLLSYNQLTYANNSGERFNELKDILYIKLVKWYVTCHGISDMNREKLINEVDKTTRNSVGVRNVLTNHEELNDNILNFVFNNKAEYEFFMHMFMHEIELYVTLAAAGIVRSFSVGTNCVPTSLVLRLVLMNVIVRQYKLGFNIEEYIIRYFETHNVLEEFTGSKNSALSNHLIQDYIDELLFDINDTTNEFLNQKKK